MATAVEIPYINYSCYFNTFREGEQFVSYHSLSMVVTGELELNDGNHRRVFGKGELYFACKNRLLKFTKRPTDEAGFKSLSIRFSDELLQELARSEDYHPPQAESTITAFKDLSGAKYLSFFMESLLQYQDLLENKTPELVLLKQREALLLLLKEAPQLRDTLLNFADPHKINLEAFMQQNYHFNVGLERFAYLTGRSLATFKRDFQKIFHTSPRSWLQQKRLQQAHYLIKEKQQRPSSVYLDLGFEDLSHFSFAFKKEFGFAPSELLKIS